MSVLPKSIRQQLKHRLSEATESSAPSATNNLYRYRSAKAVLDEFEELEREEIYFSTTEELNDPMEGLKNMFWSGDEIVWKALLKHYIYCLIEATSLAFILGQEFDPKCLKTLCLPHPIAFQTYQ